ncbi:SGNH/GDSL hydrolase family protein [Streptomyces sp. BPPL-273]|uniref:SGNH hydrolase n=1 Tax=Streptomyces parvulus TaxID=146923 RepID=A0A191UY81_9ACTN|nr:MULTISPECIES: SGNH/GDSL hydrolase family protein [Streptomyces]ANJ07716.1 SGNH hydrolase [Streptomyces parvulus]WHM32744.1 SGNH/GDSL hydrolase family protein [Streptomyces sp. BPPL-273]GGR70505.1 SGNH hydrolase [Streptomyces parvulus]
MTRGRDGGAGAPPTKHRALLAAIVTLIVAISAAIYAGASADDGSTDQTPLASGRFPRGEAAPASTGSWVGAWSTSPAAAEPGTETTGMAGRSVRNVVHAGVGGTSARITLSNLYGQSPLTVTHASIALAAGPDTAAAVADTMRRLTFRGSPRVIIPAGGQVISDVARIAVPYGADVLVTTYSPVPSGPVTYHPQARQTSFLAAGDRTADVTAVGYTTQTPYWRYLTALDVLSHEANGTVVAIGDSITDGFGSEVNANHRWTDVLAERLHEAAGQGRKAPRYSVVNQGISGNRILTSREGRPADNPSALSRFDRDVLQRTNVKVVVIVLGVNDILHSPELADRDSILAGLRTLTDRAHARGLKVVGATIMPFGGYRAYTPEREAMRQEINGEIRSGRVFDEVVDFDKALRDAYDPRRLRGDYDSGDHLHPGDKGYARMGQVLDLDDLKGAVPVEA